MKQSFVKRYLASYLRWDIYCTVIKAMWVWVINPAPPLLQCTKLECNHVFTFTSIKNTVKLLSLLFLYWFNLKIKTFNNSLTRTKKGHIQGNTVWQTRHTGRWQGSDPNESAYKMTVGVGLLKVSNWLQPISSWALNMRCLCTNICWNKGIAHRWQQGCFEVAKVKEVGG